MGRNSRSWLSGGGKGNTASQHLLNADNFRLLSEVAASEDRERELADVVRRPDSPNAVRHQMSSLPRLITDPGLGEIGKDGIAVGFKM